MLFWRCCFGKLRCRRSLEQRHDRHALHIRSGNAFEMRADAAQFGVHKGIDEMQVSIEPREQAVLNFIMNRERDLGTGWPDFAEIDQSHHFDIPAGGLKRELVLGIAIYRQQGGAGFEPKRAAKAKVDGLARSHGRLGDHEKLPFVGLNAGEPGLGFLQRLAHVKRFFEEHISRVVYARML